MKIAAFVAVVLVALATLSPVAAQEPEPLVELTPVVEEEVAVEEETAAADEVQPVEEAPVEPVDDTVEVEVPDEKPSNFGRMIGILAFMAFLGLGWRFGFEYLVSVPIFERWFEGEKDFQAWLVVAAPAILAVVFKVDVTQALVVGGAPLTIDELLGQIGTGSAQGLAAVLWHVFIRARQEA